MFNLLGMQALASLGVVGTSSGNQGMLAQQYSSQYNNNIAQQQYAWAQQQLAVVPPTWAFNGTIYNTAREMADAIWHTDCPDKTHFLLKYE